MWREQVRKDVLATLLDWWQERGASDQDIVKIGELDELAAEIAESIPAPDGSRSGFSA